MEDSLIEVHTFYEPHQVNYTEEELQLYRELTGMPLFESYEELMGTLEYNKGQGRIEKFYKKQMHKVKGKKANKEKR